MDKLEQLHWPLIMGMGALALIRPLLNIVGWLDGLGRPFGPLFITALISKEPQIFSNFSGDDE